MTKRTNRLKTLRSFSIGFGAAALALACNAEDGNNTTPGGVAGSGSDVPTDVDPVDPPPNIPEDTPVDPCVQNPLLAECREDGEDPPVTGSQRDLDQAAAENILRSACGSCHGPALTETQALAGMNYIDDIDQLVEKGKIIPLNSTGSLVIQRMVRGEMPPPGSGDRVSEADIDTVASFIDNPNYWDDFVPQDCSDQENVVDFDQLYQDINQDLGRADNDDQVFLRYISLTNRVTAGVCADTALDRDRQALTKMLNMLSIRATIEEPTPINREETLFRIDLRDYDWNRAIQVEGQDFADVWEAIAENNPYAVEFVGDDVDDVKEDTGTDFPLMFADQMLDVAIIGNLYYAIINVDVNQTLGQFIQTLGIDVDANIADEEAIRAGTTKSRISRQDRLVERHDIEVRGGAFWQSFDFNADDANQSIFEDPFGFTPGGTEAIFTLPNGMLGYIIADENDNIVEDSDILLDTSQNNFRAVTAVSCSNCHALGFLPVEDEVREITLANRRDLQLDNDEVEQIEAIYVSPQAFEQQVKEDSEAFYQRALQQANLPIKGGDPVASVFIRFDDDITLEDAAGDLGLLPEELREELNLLNPVLQVLDRGTLDRDDFTALYVESLCALSTPLANQPDPAICDALLDD